VGPYSFTGLASFTGYVFTGDPIDVFVRVADNHAVHGVYWEVLPAGQRDSVRGNDSSDFVHTIGVQTQPTWTGTIQFRAWTRDGSGNVSDTIASQPGAIDVFPTVGSSPTLTSIPGRISDVAFDEKRGVMYLLQDHSISVFSPTSLSVVRTIALPDAVPGFDVTPSGDSIVTVLANSRAMAVVDLTQASAVQIVPLALDSSVTRLLDIRVARTGLAVITAENAPVGVDRIYTYDLVSGTLRLRSDAPTLGQNSRGLLERSTDGRVIVANGLSASFVRYDAASDAFGPALIAQIDDAEPALDSTGAHVAVFGNLYDASLNYLFTIAAAQRGPGLSAFSPDGQTHYMAMAPTTVQGVWASPGVVRSRVSDGSIIDRIPVFMLTTLVRVSPDGSMLAAVEGYNPGPSRIAVINLSQLH
jgi:sugar lactone lactonase YvrE